MRRYIDLSSVITSCKKKEAPIVESSEITEIAGTTAKSGGTINDEGSGPIISRGVCWNTTVNPTIANNMTSDGTAPAVFRAALQGLTALLNIS